MNYSIVQKIEIWFIKQAINVVWYVDLITGYPLNQSLKFSSRPYVFVSMILIGVLTYFIYIPFIKENVSSRYISQSASVSKLIQQNNTQVLGAGAPPIIKIIKKSEIPFPEITSKSILVVDSNTSEVLYEKNTNSKYASASTTKLMTALISLDVYKLDDVLTMSKECSEVESTKANLPLGEKFTVETLLNAMLVFSAGDAACLLGTGKIDSNEYLYLMNEKAFDLKMENTFFTNTIGLDGLNGAQFSSAGDLYILAKASMANPLIREIVRKPSVTVYSVDNAFTITLENTNKLLKEVPNTVGIKTGTTQEAGEVFIYEYIKDMKDIVIIVMGSNDRFGDTKKALTWVLENYSWE